MTEVKKFEARAFFQKAFDKALVTQLPLATKNVSRLRRVNPDKTPEQLIRYLNKWYVGAVAVTGGAAGAAAVVPNGVVQVPVALADLSAYTQASVLYVLSVAEIHGLHIEDGERRRVLVSAALLGGAASKKVMEKIVPNLAKHWGSSIVKNFSREAIKNINKVLGPRFITIAGGKMGVLVLSKQVPLLLGAALGAGGNALFASGVVKATKQILGPAPKKWPASKTAPKKKI
jgi:hypothetical protein